MTISVSEGVAMAELRARTSFAVGRIHIREGMMVPSDHPVVKGREHLFDAPVETATAVPGEKRTVKSPCPVEGCDFEGGPRGLAIHRSRVH